MYSSSLCLYITFEGRNFQVAIYSIAFHAEPLLFTFFLTEFHIFLHGVHGGRAHRNGPADMWLFSPDAFRSCLSSWSDSQLRSVTLNALDRSARQHPKPSGPRLFSLRPESPTPLGPRSSANHRSFAALSRGPWKHKQMFHTFAIGVPNKRGVEEKRAPLFLRPLSVNVFLYLMLSAAFCFSLINQRMCLRLRFKCIDGPKDKKISERNSGKLPRLGKMSRADKQLNRIGNVCLV